MIAPLTWPKRLMSHSAAAVATAVATAVAGVKSKNRNDEIELKIARILHTQSQRRCQRNLNLNFKDGSIRCLSQTREREKEGGIERGRIEDPKVSYKPQEFN